VIASEAIALGQKLGPEIEEAGSALCVAASVDDVEHVYHQLSALVERLGVALRPHIMMLAALESGEPDRPEYPQ
jgi:hypothetical protein